MPKSKCLLLSLSETGEKGVLSNFCPLYVGILSFNEGSIA